MVGGIAWACERKRCQNSHWNGGRSNRAAISLDVGASLNLGRDPWPSCLATVTGFVIFGRTHASTSDIDYHRPARGPCWVRCGMGSDSSPEFETRRASSDSQLGRRTACEGALRCVRVLETTARGIFGARAGLPWAGRDSLPRLRRVGHGGDASRSRGPLGKCGMAVGRCPNRKRNQSILCFENGVGESGSWPGLESVGRAVPARRQTYDGLPGDHLLSCGALGQRAYQRQTLSPKTRWCSCIA